MSQEKQAIDLAWAAGFIDGEGCFTTHKCSLVLVVTQSRIEPLERLGKILEAKVLGPYTRSDANLYQVKPHYVVRVNGHRLEPLVKELWPYLSLPKRQQYNACIARVNEARKDRAAKKLTKSYPS